MYRLRLRKCSLCGSPMRRVPVGAGGEHSEVDTCDHCGCAFLEYFDGEPGALARGLAAHGPSAGPQGAVRTRPRCPDCGLHLGLLRYLGRGPDVYRCRGCMAVFATPPQLRALAAHAELPNEPDTFLKRLGRLLWG